MWLDMYVERKTYVKNREHTPKENIIKIKLSGDTKWIDTEKIIYISQKKLCIGEKRMLYITDL